MSPALPESLYLGRNNAPGPRTGGYLTFAAGPIAVTNVTATVIPWGIVVPFDCRIERVDLATVTAVAGGTLTGQFMNHATAFQTSGAVTLIDTDADGDADTDTFDMAALLGSATGVYADGTANGTVGTVLLTASGQKGRRDLVRNTRLFLHLVGDSAVDLADMYLYVTVVPTGHVHDDSASD